MAKTPNCLPKRMNHFGTIKGEEAVHIKPRRLFARANQFFILLSRAGGWPNPEKKNPD